MTKDNIVAVILAAGKGTRMKSDKAKVLHEVFFRPMLHWVLDTAQGAGIDDCAVIVGHQRQRVLDCLQDYTATPVTQEEQLGTGHAVLCAENACAQRETVMILCGDTPLIQSATLKAMVEQHKADQAMLTLMTTQLDNPFGYGRIISRNDGSVEAIVEQKDASKEQQAIKEINAGIYLVDREFLFQALKKVGTDNSQGEVYLTDIVAIANQEDHSPRKFFHNTAVDVLGVNSRVELSQAHSELQRRRNVELMLSGVTMYGPDTITVAPAIEVGRDSTIHPFVRVTGNSSLGTACTLGPGCQLNNCNLGDKCIVGANAVLENITLAEQQTVPPLTYLSDD
jgi:bifunctional UDP-N-acetylglucosamine pyrophosphorylase/glucosamine-1-phosphate N-acetyltransferase